MKVFYYVTEIIEGRRDSPVFRSVLRCLSWLYHGAVFLRNLAYDLKLLPVKTLPLTVISVGNIAACGTGKTPLVALLVSTLAKAHSVAIVTRGFKSQTEKQGTVCCLDPNDPNAYRLYGDEPLLLARKTEVPVIVGVNRFKGGMLAHQKECEYVVLDDGLQHRRLHQDLIIAVVDANDPFCRYRFLPYGFLRDEVRSLRRADVVVAIPIHTMAQYSAICHKLSPVTRAPVVGMYKAPVLTQALPSKVGLFCGIGRPEGFIQTVRDLKLEIVDTLITLDHELPTQDRLAQFAAVCAERGAQALVCTEKDHIKLLAGARFPLPIVSIPIELKIVAGIEHWEQIINQFKKG